MGCTKCGTDFRAIKLIVKDLIRQMIDEGKLQEGLLDCQDARLYRDHRVVTCDILASAVCQLIEDGTICVNEPQALAYDEDTDTLSLIMKDGSTFDTKLSLKDTKLKTATLDKGIATFTLTDDSVVTLDLSSLLSGTNIGNGLEFVGDKVNVKVDGVTIKIENGVLKAVMPKAYNDKALKDRLTALEAKRHFATVQLKGIFDEEIGFAHTATEKE